MYMLSGKERGEGFPSPEWRGGKGGRPPWGEILSESGGNTIRGGERSKEGERESIYWKMGMQIVFPLLRGERLSKG